MKVKTDFVSNSSCASFIIPKKFLNQEQINAIHKHIHMSRLLLECHRGPKIDIKLYNSPHDEWNIIENKNTIEGHTSMDNFDMMWFLLKIGIDEKYIEYHRH